MISDVFVRKLREMDTRALREMSEHEFMLMGRADFLGSKTLEILDKLGSEYCIDGRMLAYLYTLAFAYRQTIFFEDLVLTDHHGPPLLAGDQQDIKPDTDRKGSANVTWVTKWLHNEPSLFQLKLERLKKQAEYIEDKITQLAKKIAHSSSKKKLPKYHDFFKKAYKAEISKGNSILSLLKTYAEQIHVNPDSLHRAYYRWKIKLAEKSFDGTRWPSEAFCRFCARLSVEFISDNQYPFGSPYFILNEGISLDSIIIMRAVRNHFSKELENNLLDKKYHLLCNKKLSLSEKQDRIKKLAYMDCLPAIKYCMQNLSEQQREKFSIRAAVLGDVDAQTDRGWTAAGFCDLFLGVASKNSLKIAQSYGLVMGSPIPQDTIIRTISFDVDCNAEPISKLIGLLKDVVVKEPEFLYFCTATRGDKKIDMHKLEVKATTQNFDLLMKNAKFLPSTMHLSFSSRHSRQKNENIRCVQLERRENKETLKSQEAH